MPSGSRLERACADFQRAWEAGRVAHAYLVVGDVRGEAREFAERVLGYLFCQSAGPRPCGRCAGCLRTREHSHPDSLWIEPEKKSRIVGVERIRQLRRLVYQTAYAGGWKACVVCGADRLGTGGSNALLKALEEPPDRSLFLLLSDAPHSLLPTILSRCQCVVLNTEPAALPEPWEGKLLEILAWRPGPGFLEGQARAARLLDLLKAIREEVSKAVAAEVEDTAETLPEAVLDARVEARYREWRTILFRAMLLWYRDLLLSVCGCDATLYHYQDRHSAIAEAARRLDQAGAARAVALVADMQRRIEQNVPEDMVVGTGFGQLRV